MSEGLTDDVQQVIDDLARRITRSVALDDLNGDLIAASRHYGDEDEYRVKVILARRMSRDIRNYLAGFHLDRITEATLVPGLTEMSFKARMCYPLRHNGSLLGYLWIIDDGTGRADPAVMASCVRISEILHARSLTSEAPSEAKARLLEQIIALADSSAAVSRLHRDQLVEHNTQFMVIAEYPAPGQVARTEGLSQLTNLIKRVDSTYRVAYRCSFVVSGVAALVIAVRAALDVDDRGQMVHVSRELAQSLFSNYSPDYTLGVSRVAGVECLRELFIQASVASFLAGSLATEERCLPWEAIAAGAGMLRSITLPFETERDRRLCEMLKDDRDGTLGHTLEVFLKHAGDTTAAASELIIHRTTLHYRLKQIRKRTGIDLADGRQRYLAQSTVLHHRLHSGPLGVFLR
jgi:hypothetical protein